MIHLNGQFDAPIDAEVTRLLTASSGSLDVGKLDQIVREVETRLGSRVYGSLLEKLFHLELEANAAKSHWKALLVHHETLCKKAGVSLDFHATALDYLVRETKLIKQPTILEMTEFQELRQNIISDAMTGLYNYRYFKESLRREFYRAKRHRTSCSLLFFDVDHFKQLNDRFGHLLGDEVLRKIADVIVSSVRTTDLACRYGGEEFAVLAPQTTRKGAWLLAERIRQGVEKLNLPELRAFDVPLTISGGVATFPGDAQEEEKLLARADEALYLAKSLGRNRIELLKGDQRGEKRLPIDVPVVFSAQPDHKTHSKTKNVSEKGLMFEVAQPLALGAIIHIEVLLQKDAPVRCVGCVTHTRTIKAHGSYEVGISIMQMSLIDQGRYRQFIASQVTA